MRRTPERIPDAVVPGALLTTTGLRNTRYCEVLLAEGSLVNLRAAVYNTIRHDVRTYPGQP